MPDFLILKYIMADNYLENRYEEHLKAKAKKERERNAAWKKRLKEYEKSLKAKNDGNGN